MHFDVLRRLRAKLAGQPHFGAELVVPLSLVYFGTGLGAREATLLESQDLSIAADLLRTFRLSADHSPLHFALLNLWLRSGGASIALLRLPSALCVALAAAVVFRLAERASGTAAGVWAALLFTTNPEVVDQARSLRLYGFGLLLCALCLERAHAFAQRKRREPALFGFLVAAVLAIHTHLFLWLWVGPLAALVATRAAVALQGSERRRALIAAAIAVVLASSQVVHGVVALSFTHERHAVYGGLSHHFGTFWSQVGRHLVLGQAEDDLRVPGYVLAAVAALPVLGLARLRPKTRVPALLAIFTPFLAAFCLSFTSEVEARYLGFALPGLAVLAGVGLASVPVFFAAGAGLAVTAISALAVVETYGAPATDWYAAAERLEALAKQGDVVAVFPGYWADTFRFYTPRRELIPVTYPVDLEHALARGQRVLLLVNGGRITADLDAYLAMFAEHRFLFRTEVRDQFEVHEVRARALLATAPERASASVVFTGIVGGGGYGWLTEPEPARAFEHLAALFASAELSVTGYAPYEPPWPARLLLGPELSARLRPQLAVAKALERVGVRAVAVSSERGGLETASAALETARLGIVPFDSDGNRPKPLMYDVGTEHVALLALGTAASSVTNSRSVATVARVREALRPSDALVVFVPAPARFDGLPTSDERAAARRLIDAGADVVIGNGGYAAKPVERYRAGVIAYSLGSLAVPPTLDLAQREASGVALRVGFDGGRPGRIDVLATTDDDQAIPHLGRVDAVPADPQDEFAAVLASFSTARVTITPGDGGAAKSLAFRTLPPVTGAEAWVETQVRAWIPWTSRGTSSRPFAGGFVDGNSYAGVRGVRSLGQPRAGIEIDAGPGASLDVELPSMLLGSRLDVEYALPDDRELSKYRSLLDENVSVSVDGGPTFSEAVPFRSGWHRRSLDTLAVAGTARRVTLRVSSPASHFPLAFSLRIAP